MSNGVHSGGCACGKVRFEARGERRALSRRRLTLPDMPESARGAVQLLCRVPRPRGDGRWRRDWPSRAPSTAGDIPAGLAAHRCTPITIDPTKSTSIQVRSTNREFGSQATSYGPDGASRGCQNFPASSCATRRAARIGGGPSRTDSSSLYRRLRGADAAGGTSDFAPPR
jgi:hypothetical protein